MDANRCALDVYNMGWARYQAQRSAGERRRRRERSNAEVVHDAAGDGREGGRR
ncbi:hypothetical protein [Streptomyces sp. NPDC005549]|uniref:hypothetical protein n=1 Tax=Streptomyces sp. NPDC005549 TaxID=3154888 RepID=UPI0033ABABEA